MDSPFREQIKLADPWHAHPVSDQAAIVFIPGPWGAKQVMLISDGGTVDARVTPGQRNQITVASGSINGARLIARNPLHIAALAATAASPDSLSIRLRLSAPAESDQLTLFLTLTAADGTQAGATAVTIGEHGCELTVPLHSEGPLSGTYRLKATLCADQSILDNARTHVTV